MHRLSETLIDSENFHEKRVTCSFEIQAPKEQYQPNIE